MLLKVTFSPENFVKKPEAAIKDPFRVYGLPDFL
jgi:hypothetical protein